MKAVNASETLRLLVQGAISQKTSLERKMVGKEETKERQTRNTEREW
jgi:hypothetical protein